MITFDFSSFERAAARYDNAARQVPFALAGALNDATEAARTQLVERTWPGHIKQRNPSFINATLRREKATKASLVATIYDRLGRAHLGLHDKGGTKRGKGRLAIPTSRVRRGAHGVVGSQQPRNLKRSVLKGNLLFQAIGRGKNSKLQLMFKLAQTARVPKDVPFTEDFETVIRREVWRNFTPRLARALATAR